MSESIAILSSEAWISSPEKLIQRQVFDQYLERHRAYVRRFEFDKAVIVTFTEDYGQEREIAREIIDQAPAIAGDWVVLHIGKKGNEVKAFAELLPVNLDCFHV